MCAKLGPATSSYGQKINLDDTLHDISYLGFNGIEVMSIPYWFEHVRPELMSEDDILCLKEKLSHFGLSPLAVSGHSELGKHEGARQFMERIKFAASLGADKIVVGSGEINGKNEQNNFFNAMECGIEIAQRHKISIALETGGNFIPTGKKMFEIIKEIHSPYVGVTYDPANVIVSGNVDPVEDIPYILPYLIHFHIKEQTKELNYHPSIGKGNVDFNNLFKILYNFGYKGDFGIEIDCFDSDISTASINLEKSLSFLYTKTNFLEFFPQRGN